MWRTRLVDFSLRAAICHPPCSTNIDWIQPLEALVHLHANNEADKFSGFWSFKIICNIVILFLIRFEACGIYRMQSNSIVFILWFSFSIFYAKIFFFLTLNYFCIFCFLFILMLFIIIIFYLNCTLFFKFYSVFLF